MNLNSIWIELPFLHCWQSNYFYPLHNTWTLSCAFSITERFPFAICIINKVLKQMKKTVKKNKKERERSLKTRKIINSKKIRFQKNCFLKKKASSVLLSSLYFSLPASYESSHPKIACGQQHCTACCVISKIFWQLPVLCVCLHAE